MFDSFYLILGLAFFLSMALNLLFAWYIRKLLKSMYETSENMVDLVEEAVTFHNHLEGIHELEVFYGDETLGNLIRHSKGFIETLEDFEEIYTLFDENEELFAEVPIDDTNTNKSPTS